MNQGHIVNAVPAPVLLPTFKPSAQLLGWGLTLLAVGSYIVGNARANGIAEAFSPNAYDNGSSTLGLVVGSIGALVGLVLAIVGTVRLATNVDLAGRVALETITQAYESASAGAAVQPPAA